MQRIMIPIYVSPAAAVKALSVEAGEDWICPDAAQLAALSPDAREEAARIARYEPVRDAARLDPVGSTFDTGMLRDEPLGVASWEEVARRLEMRPVLRARKKAEVLAERVDREHGEAIHADKKRTKTVGEGAQALAKTIVEQWGALRENECLTRWRQSRDIESMVLPAAFLDEVDAAIARVLDEKALSRSLARQEKELREMAEKTQAALRAEKMHALLAKCSPLLLAQCAEGLLSPDTAFREVRAEALGRLSVLPEAGTVDHGDLLPRIENCDGDHEDHERIIDEPADSVTPEAYVALALLREATPGVEWRPVRLFRRCVACVACKCSGEPMYVAHADVDPGIGHLYEIEVLLTNEAANDAVAALRMYDRTAAEEKEG